MTATTGRTMTATLRRFLLVRHHDVTGVSGTGVVAQGVRFIDGTVAVRWSSKTPVTSVWESVEDMLAIHGHDGCTIVRWLDPCSRSEPE
jgi:hypothetical protein